MKWKKLLSLILAGSPLLGTIGCQTPEQEAALLGILGSAVGSAGMMSPDLKTRQLGAFNRAMGEATLSNLNNQRLSGAIENTGRSIGQESAGYSSRDDSRYTRRVWEEESQSTYNTKTGRVVLSNEEEYLNYSGGGNAVREFPKGGYICGEGTVKGTDSEGVEKDIPIDYVKGALSEGFKTGSNEPARRVRIIPTLEDKFFIKYWLDKNKDGNYKDEESRPADNLINLETLINNGEGIVLEAGFGFMAEDKPLIETLRDSKGDVVFQARSIISGSLLAQDKTKTKSDKPTFYLRSLVNIGPLILIEHLQKNQSTANQQQFFMSYELEGREVHVKRVVVQLSTQ